MLVRGVRSNVLRQYFESFQDLGSSWFIFPACQVCPLARCHRPPGAGGTCQGSCSTKELDECIAFAKCRCGWTDQSGKYGCFLLFCMLYSSKILLHTLYTHFILARRLSSMNWLLQLVSCLWHMCQADLVGVSAAISACAKGAKWVHALSALQIHAANVVWLARAWPLAPTCHVSEFFLTIRLYPSSFYCVTLLCFER